MKAFQTLEKRVCHNGFRYETELPWKMTLIHLTTNFLPKHNCNPLKTGFNKSHIYFFVTTKQSQRTSRTNMSKRHCISPISRIHNFVVSHTTPLNIKLKKKSRTSHKFCFIIKRMFTQRGSIDWTRSTVQPFSNFSQISKVQICNKRWYSSNFHAKLLYDQNIKTHSSYCGTKWRGKFFKYINAPTLTSFYLLISPTLTPFYPLSASYSPQSYIILRPVEALTFHCFRSPYSKTESWTHNLCTSKTES